MLPNTLYISAILLLTAAPFGSAVTRESALADAAIRVMDRHTTNWARSSVLCAAYTGMVPNVPLDAPLVEVSPNATGITQQALWGLFTKYALHFPHHNLCISLMLM